MASLSVVAGLSILLLGDSHMARKNSLIDYLHEDLQKRGAQVHSIGVCGAPPSAWVKGSTGDCGGAERIGNNAPVLKPVGVAPPLADLIKAEHPDLILIVMGDSIGGYDAEYFPINWARQTVSALADTIPSPLSGGGKTRCVWVGPPWGEEGGFAHKTYARAEQVNQFLAKNTAPCTYVNSQTMSKQGQWPTFDGIHFKPDGYRAWAGNIAKALDQLPAKDLKKK